MPKLRALPDTAPVHPPASVQDLCDATGLGHASVRELVRLGELPGYVHGRKVVVPWAAFQDYQHGVWEPRPVRIAAMSRAVAQAMETAIAEAVREQIARYMEDAA